ncbi:DUF3967 domain-containing protein [Bacillus cereus group sp. Bc222]|uniref:DUF3967 domain-containing protein n=1 Tax=Bacillus cereus group sp. Bc222 TaxID=3018111 RepID=UPI0022DF248D|nr:DUF3967 domain-containing protein [Bacillus cereus group sp. Bc222]MDA2242391.1 DUF3967 domain-containing protein [Bacillus cereus group sp. Bc222]
MIDKEGENRWLTADFVAKEIGVSSMTIKRNCNTYKEFILFKQEEKNKYYIFRECVSVLKYINNLRSKENFQHKDILERLNREGYKKYLNIDITDSTQQESTQTTEQLLLTADQVREIIAEELSKIEQNQVSKRDEQLMYLIREIQDMKKLILEEKQTRLEINSSKEEQKNIKFSEAKKESWWRRMWNR